MEYFDIVNEYGVPMMGLKVLMDFEKGNKC